MKIAVMQPYLFPYIGYYQLIKHVDVFVLYDDVNYIKNGYINRNKLKINGESRWFTLPIENGSSYSKIKDTTFSKRHDQKIKKMVEQNYSKAPFFEDVYPLFCKVLDYKDRSAVSITELSLKVVTAYLGIHVRMIRSSELDYDRTLSSADRLIDLAHQFDCDQYVNSIGGKLLYHKSYFEERGIHLSFLRTIYNTQYEQGKPPFLPYLSFLDQLMWCSKEQICFDLESYCLE